MATPEGEIKNAILAYLATRRDIFAWPNDSVGVYDPVRKTFRKNRSRFHMRGVADILGIITDQNGIGTPLAIEVKSPKGVLSPEQKIFLEEFNKRGGIGIVARSIDDAIDALRLPISNTLGK